MDKLSRRCYLKCGVFHSKKLVLLFTLKKQFHDVTTTTDLLVPFPHTAKLSTHSRSCLLKLTNVCIIIAHDNQLIFVYTAIQINNCELYTWLLFFMIFHNYKIVILRKNKKGILHVWLRQHLADWVWVDKICLTPVWFCEMIIFPWFAFCHNWKVFNSSY